VISDLKIARRFGWRYEWVRDLDADVHQILVEELVRESEKAERD
jgi:hypothetical protein